MTELTDEELIEDGLAPAPEKSNSLAFRSGLVDDWNRHKNAASAAEETAKEEKEKVRSLEEKTIPEAMFEMRTKSHETWDGFMIGIEDFVTGSVPKKNEDEAFEWLRENGHGDIIKTDITISFTKEQDEEAQALFKRLAEEGFTVNMKPSVHASTLKSWAKKMLEKGVEFPRELLGIYVGRKAKITPPKKK